MLGRFVSARIKAAEQAVGCGRLDEALRLALADDLSGQARIHKVLDQVARGLFDRAEHHFKADRFTEALEDLSKAEAAGCDRTKSADLRTIVQAADEERDRNRQSRADRLQAAQDRIAAGSLRAARDILLKASQADPKADRLQAEVEDREARVARLLHEVADHSEQACWAAAVQRLAEARKLHAKNDDLARWEKHIADRVVSEALQALHTGRLSAVTELLHVLGGVGESHPGKNELAAVLKHISLATADLRNGRFENARRSLMAATHIVPGAAWLQTACDQLRECDELVTQLHGGPLGLLQQSDVGPSAPVAQLGDTVATVFASPGTVDSDLPTRLLMWVDGAGSYLILRGSTAWIGRAVGRSPADIPLMADLSEQHAQVARSGDDYFLVAGRNVNVGGKNMRQKLLQDGDRIILGKRAKMVFKVPSRKSASAVLDLSDSAKMPNDVRRVILFDRFVTVSRNQSAHVVVQTAGEPLVLFERDSKLWIKLRDCPANQAPTQVVLGQTIEMAGVSLMIEEWKSPRDGLRA
jgi:hypothetical protein